MMSIYPQLSPLAQATGENGDRPLRLTLQLDAVATGAVGALALIAGPALDDLLGAPLSLLWPVGLFLVAYAAAIWFVGSRLRISKPAAWGAVALNGLWAIDSAILVAADPTGLTNLGIAFVLVQAAAVALFATLQFLALRRVQTAGR